MNLIDKEIEMNWGSIYFKGIVIDNKDFFYEVRVTESNTDKIKIGSTRSIMEDDITAIL